MRCTHPPPARSLHMLVPISVPRPQDFDPFHIPMPVVAPGVTAETVRPSHPTCPTPRSRCGDGLAG